MDSGDGDVDLARQSRADRARRRRRERESPPRALMSQDLLAHEQDLDVAFSGPHVPLLYYDQRATEEDEEEVEI